MPAAPVPPLELVTVRTSEACISYRLYTVPEGITDAPRLVWSNRAYADVPASHQGAQRRAEAWARAHGYRIVAGKEGQRKRAYATEGTTASGGCNLQNAAAPQWHSYHRRTTLPYGLSGRARSLRPTPQRSQRHALPTHKSTAGAAPTRVLAGTGGAVHADGMHGRATAARERRRLAPPASSDSRPRCMLGAFVRDQDAAHEDVPR